MIENPRVFFYGTFMDPKVLRGFGAEAYDVQPAELRGFRILIRPRVNLIRDPSTSVFGATATLSQRDLANLYLQLEVTFGLRYFPIAVLADLRDSSSLPALCYINHDMPDRSPDPAYVKELAGCVRALGHPEWYIRRIESFAQ